MNTLEYVKMEGKEEGLKEGLKEGLAEGFARGQAEERRNAVVALLANTEFSIEKIAGILAVPMTFVIKVNDESKVRK